MHHNMYVKNIRQLCIYIYIQITVYMFVEGYEIGETKEIVFVSKNIDDYIRKVFMISVQHK